jgi:A/G-specific adenine glycosylase
MLQTHLQLLNWYHQNKRNLPWRNTKNPYFIWLSEVILQQTRVAQGLPYYQNFTQRYKTVIELANAPLQDVLKLWQGLGYYSRARNMHQTAQIVASQYGGKFPNTYRELVKLKGIGPYTAAAIASFAYNLPHAVIDGNVFRVLSRLFLISEPINTTRGKKVFEATANEFLNLHAPAEHNQAIMELGATVCLPKKPNCTVCPLNSSCMAFTIKKMADLPVKLPKSAVKTRYFNYLIVINKNHILLTKRKEKDIWQHLFEPILIESAEAIKEPELVEIISGKGWFNPKKATISYALTYRHVLTHQKLICNFYLAEIKGEKPKINEGIWVAVKDVDKYPTHRLFEKFLLNYKLPF